VATFEALSTCTLLSAMTGTGLGRSVDDQWPAAGQRGRRFRLVHDHLTRRLAEDNARDRTYLVLAKPNVIMNEIRLLRGLGWQEMRVPVGRGARTTTPRRFGTLNAPSETRVLAPANCRQTGWIANRPPTSQPP